MSELLYLDSCVWLAYFLNQRGSDIAYNILMRTLRCDFRVVVSDWLLTELKKYASPQETKIFFNSLARRNKIVKVGSSEVDFGQAREIDEHFQDPLHAILANKAGASRLATWNIQDFGGCRHLVKIVFPEDI